MDEMRRLLALAGSDPSVLLNYTDASGNGGLGEADRRTLIRDVHDKAAKAKEEEVKRRAEQSRRIDYLTRALREAERPKVDALAAAAAAEDASFVDSTAEAMLARARARHEAAVTAKARLARIDPFRVSFEASVLARRHTAAAAERVSGAQRVDVCVCVGGVGWGGEVSQQQ